MKAFLSDHPIITRDRYIRLMALTTIQLVFTVPLGIWSIIIDVQLGLRKWISFANTHSDQSRVVQVPAVIWRSRPINVVSFEFSRWSAPACAIVIFLFFGLVSEAFMNYKSAFRNVARRLGFNKPVKNSIVASSTGSVVGIDLSDEITPTHISSVLGLTYSSVRILIVNHPLTGLSHHVIRASSLLRVVSDGRYLRVPFSSKETERRSFLPYLLEHL
jgi:hypothetical protein